MTRTLTARWVFPVAGPPLEYGLVTIRDDKIEAVEPRGTRTADEDLGNVAIIPGLVNPHTHLDLSGARGLIPPTDPEHFTDWLKGVIAYRKTRTAEQVQADIRGGLGECLEYGTTLIGDIASGGASWEIVAESPMRSVVFREMLGLQNRRVVESGGEAKKWMLNYILHTTCRPGLSPHSPFSASWKLIRMTQSFRTSPAAIHLAESPAEIALLESQTGPFLSFLQELDAWHPDGLSRSIEWVLWRTRRWPPVVFIHCNYLSPNSEIWPNQTIVYCPRTHAAFGHPPHPFREFLNRGIRVCLGTDSLASNPDLDILAEARFVHERYLDFPGDRLLKMVTLSGAEALGWADECGSLAPGKSADLVAVPLPNRDGDPHELVFSNEMADAPRRTVFRGNWRS
ncbi:MAG TPA: amidohydrolase family protein [Fimbriiglobus sp.]|jgi:cytosine/adenosine deaminase-related metal-dependent hydrolase